MIDYGTPTLEIDRGPVSLRLRTRDVLVTAVLSVLAVVVAVVLMAVGDFPLSVPEVVTALLGTGEDEFARTVVLTWRLPTAIAAVVLGALLGVGGAIFQSLTRNPLGSPDIIGFDAGSYTAVLLTMLIMGNHNYWRIAGASLLGGIVVATVVYVLAYRGGVQGFRLIIVGIGISAMLGSLNSFLITRADLKDAMSVGFWSAGTLSRTTWGNLVPTVVLSLAVAVACTVLAPSMRQLEMGDDAARSHGVRLGPARAGLMVTGVATTAIVTASAGPIGFIALAAPQIARRLTGTAGEGLASSAAMGAMLLVGAQGISVLTGMAGVPVPVGLVTVCVGGLYFLFLLGREARRQL